MSLAQQALVAGAAVALVGHQVEWVRRDPRWKSSALFAVAANVALVAWLRSQGAVAIEIVYIGLLAHAAFVVTLLTSMSIYRLYFHPLRHVPAPSVFAKLSSLYRYKIGLDGRLGQHLIRWHDQFGDMVRIGPNYGASFAQIASDPRQSRSQTPAMSLRYTPSRRVGSTRQEVRAQRSSASSRRGNIGRCVRCGPRSSRPKLSPSTTDRSTSTATDCSPSCTARRRYSRTLA